VLSHSCGHACAEDQTSSNIFFDKGQVEDQSHQVRLFLVIFLVFIVVYDQFRPLRVVSVNVSEILDVIKIGDDIVPGYALDRFGGDLVASSRLVNSLLTIFIP